MKSSNSKLVAPQAKQAIEQMKYEIANELTNKGIGQSTAVGIGGDPVTGDNYVDILTRF